MTTNDEDFILEYYILSFGAARPIHNEKISRETLALEFGKAMTACGITPTVAMIHDSKFFVNPQDIALKDTWLTLPIDVRQAIVTIAPNLAVAVELIAGIDPQRDYVQRPSKEDGHDNPMEENGS